MEGEIQALNIKSIYKYFSLKGTQLMSFFIKYKTLPCSIMFHFIFFITNRSKMVKINFSIPFCKRMLIHTWHQSLRFQLLVYRI